MPPHHAASPYTERAQIHNKSPHKKRFYWLHRYPAINADVVADERIDWLRATPFISVHLACFGVVWVGASSIAVTTAIVLYALRMFALTGFYHRYFSHRTFHASRAVQLVFAVIGASCVQRGPLWWAAHHRHHHRVTDTPDDPHSPEVHGFLWSHIGWFLTPRYFYTDLSRVPDLAKYPELCWVDRFAMVVPATLAVCLYLFGALVQHLTPRLGTSGMQMLVWFCISTALLFSRYSHHQLPSASLGFATFQNPR